MKIQCGTDIIEISRIKESIENLQEKFLERIYTKNEIDYCESKGRSKYQHYAARFAAKEAAFKAVSEYMEGKYSDISWQDFETVNDKNGRPYINIKFLDKSKIENIDISISHCKDYAIANVSILFK